ncbi:hypothetical protein AB0933_32670 [Streptomyces venezuelae]|uniref:hypothetical protein n=1 Tax=Streptomyces venezuelae TaxID=54571 RepID=UPI003451581C
MTKRPARSRVKHGDPTCADYGCKREECIKARRFKQKRNKLLRQTGRPGTVPSDRAAAHIARFRAANLEDRVIIEMMGLSRNTFYRLLRGLPVTRDSEQRVLSVPAPRPAAQMVALFDVPSVCTQRRLQALAWQGWPPEVLEGRLGVHAGWIVRCYRRKAVTAATRTRVAGLYDEFWNVLPEDVGVDAGRARAVRDAAIEAGFCGPLAWDDDTIDDPDALPQTDAMAPLVSEGGNLVDRWLMGESVVLAPRDKVAALLHLYEWSVLPPAQIAARLEMSESAAEQIWFRHRRKARAEGKPVPWRRRWELRTKELTKSEMGAAA